MQQFKQLLILSLGFFILNACGGDENIDENTGLVNNLFIQGQIEGAANEELLVEAQSQQGVISVAKTILDAEGKFELEGNIPGMGIYSIRLGENPKNAVVVPLDVNDRVMIKAKKETFAVKPNFSGTKWAKPLNQYMALFNDFAQKQMEQMPKLDNPEEQLKLFAKLKKPISDFAVKQVSEDPSNPVNIVLASLILPSQETGYAGWDPQNLELLRKIETAFMRKYPTSPITGMLTQQLASVESQYESYMRYNSGTMTAPEIALSNPEGKLMKLSALKGKVVLIDFWASWCGPCRKENPNVVRLYKQYKNKGFEIFSVSLDQDEAAWKAAIVKDELIWPNHVSDLMGWQTPLTQTYGFQSIPHTVLLNREGNIVGVGLRGEQLEQKLQEELNKK